MFVGVMPFNALGVLCPGFNHFIDSFFLNILLLFLDNLLRVRIEQNIFLRPNFLVNIYILELQLILKQIDFPLEVVLFLLVFLEDIL
jgi:hypothetical protein